MNKYLEKISELKKEALIPGVGVTVASSKNDKHHLSVGFPYGVGYDYTPSSKKGLSPSVGVGLMGPRVGLMYKGGKKPSQEEVKKDDK